jgi:hypothetical protein
MEITKTTSKMCKCSNTEVEKFRNIFNTNPSIKDIFKNSINVILKDVFPKNHYDKGKYGLNEMAGVYDLEQNGRSVINKLNTNYNCFCILLRDVNLVLKSQNKDTIDFNSKDTTEQILDVKNFVKIIDEYKTRIFDQNSQTFKTLMSVLGQTHHWGEQREERTVELLKKQFGENNVKSIGSLGSDKDMIGGIDCEIEIDGKLTTGQIKPFTQLIKEKDTITIIGSASVKPYKTDWLIFSKNDREIILIKNENSKIVQGNFVFPKENLKYTII